MSGARYKRSDPSKRTLNGKVYDSQAEMRHAELLQHRQRIGEITELREQVPFVICPKDGKGTRDLTYRADFTYIEDGELQVVDVKGHRTQLFILKKRLVKHLHGIDIREVR